VSSPSHVVRLHIPPTAKSAVLVKNGGLLRIFYQELVRATDDGARPVQFTKISSQVLGQDDIDAEDASLLIDDIAYQLAASGFVVTPQSHPAEAAIVAAWDIRRRAT
jgi:hypothetical protein